MSLRPGPESAVLGDAPAGKLCGESAVTRLDHVLRIGQQLRFARIVEQADETAAKANKQKESASSKKPYSKDPPPKFLKEFDEDDWPAPTYKGFEVMTVKGYGSASTELERQWLRQNYGNEWSKAAASLRSAMKKQARKVLSFQIAPKVIEAIESEQASATKEWNDLHLTPEGAPKLDWAKEVLPALKAEFPPPLDWRMEGGEWLSRSDKDARADKTKEALRKQKMATMDGERDAFVANRTKARIDKVVEDINFPDAKLKRLSRALLRHWFNRKGTDGKDRVWNKPGLDEEEDAGKKKTKAVDSDVPAEMHKMRLEWAKLQAEKGFDAENPPAPPVHLYLLLDVKPQPELYLPDKVQEISAAGGQWLWKHMRILESMDIENTQTYAGSGSGVEQAEQYWQEDFRIAQSDMIRDSYQPFIDSVDEMSEIPQAKDVAYNYTVGSGRFNKYLLWPADLVGGDPAKIPAFGAGKGGVAGNADAGEIGPPDKLHRLYKLINRCPRLPKSAVFIRAVKRKADLPHNLGKSAAVEPAVGTGYLNVTFMSTSSAAPDDYTSGLLSSFYNHGDGDGGCCMMAVTCPEGAPVLPLVLGGSSTSAYASEREVVLPPGLVLVFQGKKRKKVGSWLPYVYFYRIAPPLA